MMPTTLFSSEQDHLARADQRFTTTAAGEGSAPIAVAASAATGRMTILVTDNHYDTTDQFVSTRPKLIEPRERHLVVLDRDQPLFTVSDGGILRRHRKSLAYVIFNKSARKRFRAGPYTRLCDIVNHLQIKTFLVMTDLPFDLIDFSTNDGVISWVNIETYDDDDDNNGDERGGKKQRDAAEEDEGIEDDNCRPQKKNRRGDPDDDNKTPLLPRHHRCPSDVGPVFVHETERKKENKSGCSERQIAELSRLLSETDINTAL
jgi:hypothetical protein